jgi:hypothetical protein
MEAVNSLETVNIYHTTSCNSLEDSNIKIKIILGMLDTFFVSQYYFIFLRPHLLRGANLYFNGFYEISFFGDT